MASACISPQKYHYDGYDEIPFETCSKNILRIKGRETSRSKIEDNEEQIHKISIPNSIHIPGLQLVLICSNIGIKWQALLHQQQQVNVLLHGDSIMNITKQLFITYHRLPQVEDRKPCNVMHTVQWLIIYANKNQAMK